MDLICLPSPPNVRRMPYLKLVANTFEEERILCCLYEVMDRGGTVVINVNESGELPGRDVTCEFKGKSNAGT